MSKNLRLRPYRFLQVTILIYAIAGIHPTLVSARPAADVIIGVSKPIPYGRAFPLLDGIFQDVASMQLKQLSLDPSEVCGVEIDQQCSLQSLLWMSCMQPATMQDAPSARNRHYPDRPWAPRASKRTRRSLICRPSLRTIARSGRRGRSDADRRTHSHGRPRHLPKHPR